MKQVFEPGDRVTCSSTERWWTPGKVYVVNSVNQVSDDEGDPWIPGRTYNFALAPEDNQTLPPQEDAALKYLKERLAFYQPYRTVNAVHALTYRELEKIVREVYGLEVTPTTALTFTSTKGS